MLYLEIVCKFCTKLGRELAIESYTMLKRIKKISSKKKTIWYSADEEWLQKFDWSLLKIITTWSSDFVIMEDINLDMMKQNGNICFEYMALLPNMNTNMLLKNQQEMTRL